MFTLSSRGAWRPLLLLLSISWLNPGTGRAQQAPPAAPPPSAAELEKRVRELEAIVRQLQAERSRERAPEALPPPAAGGVVVTPFSDLPGMDGGTGQGSSGGSSSGGSGSGGSGGGGSSSGS